MREKQLYLIDATAFCYRAFYGLRNLSTSFGQPTNAIYGFIMMLNKIMKENKPEWLAVCFDVSRDTIRQKKFADYKIQRPPMPDGLSSQIAFIKEIVKGFGIGIVEKEGYEADDVIATLAHIAKEKKVLTTIVSSDKDVLQLVNEFTTVLSPYKDEGTIYDEKKVFERYGVKPSQITDIIALMGDDADNIPSVPGVGEKTAVGLIKQFDTLNALLDNITQIKQEKIRKSIQENIDRVHLNKELAVLEKNVDLGIRLEELKIGGPNYRELFRIFKHLEFKRLLQDLPLNEENAKTIQVAIASDGALPDLLEGCDELIMYGENADTVHYCAKDKIFRLENTGKNLKQILADHKIKKISHNLKKLKLMFARSNIVLEGVYFDTMIAGYLVNPSKPEYKLSDLSWDFLDSPVQEKTLDSAQAIAIIRQLVPRLESELKNKSLFNLFSQVEMPLVSVLAEMEESGIKLDKEVLKHISADLEKRLITLIEEIYTLSACQFNINSPKQLRDVLFVKLRLPVIKKSKTGPSTDEEVLNKLASQHKLPALLLIYRQLMKLKTTYVDTLPNLIDAKTNRIHTSFNQTGTETGRLSSSNPNLQNIPIKTEVGRNIRKAVVSFSKDSLLLSCDYSQIELRILAHASKDEHLITAFNKGRDIHKITASLIYDIDEKEVTEEMRDVAKRVNFGIIYGLTAFGLSRDLAISLTEAQNFIDAYFLRYPKVKEYMQEQINLARKEGFVTTILGRRRYIPEINNKNQLIRQFAERQAVNTPIQGSASDLIKLAMVHIGRHIKMSGLKSRMILQIHDELVFDVPEQETKEFAQLVKEEMENVFILDVPIRVDIKRGKNWLEMEDIKQGGSG